MPYKLKRIGSKAQAATAKSKPRALAANAKGAAFADTADAMWRKRKAKGKKPKMPMMKGMME